MNHPELQVGCCHRAEPLWSSSVRPTHRNMSALLSRCNIKLCSSEHLTWNLEDESDMQMASLAEPCGPINPNCWLMLCSISCSLHQDQTAAGVPAVLPAVLQVRTAAATHSLTPPTHTQLCCHSELPLQTRPFKIILHVDKIIYNDRYDLACFLEWLVLVKYSAHAFWTQNLEFKICF